MKLLIHPSIRRRLVLDSYVEVSENSDELTQLFKISMKWKRAFKATSISVDSCVRKSQKNNEVLMADSYFEISEK